MLSKLNLSQFSFHKNSINYRMNIEQRKQRMDVSKQLINRSPTDFLSTNWLDIHVKLRKATQTIKSVKNRFKIFPHPFVYT